MSNQKVMRVVPFQILRETKFIDERPDLIIVSRMPDLTTKLDIRKFKSWLRRECYNAVKDNGKVLIEVFHKER